MKVKTIVRGAVLTALIIALQALTKAGGQFVTGSCVNAVLAVGACSVSLPAAMGAAILSPFAAYLLGIGPQMLPIVPMIALGNIIYVYLLGKLRLHKALSLTIAASAKFLALYFGVVQILCRILPLADKQQAMFSAMFSWPQLVTAIVGGVVALAIAPVLKKALA
ncbi:MAG: hypothetical protein IIY04_06260 [Oscillospiraceae bacterium]|nr:hypothetical protein [Oscillospiraceae bacterium]